MCITATGVSKIINQSYNIIKWSTFKCKKMVSGIHFDVFHSLGEFCDQGNKKELFLISLASPNKFSDVEADKHWSFLNIGRVGF